MRLVLCDDHGMFLDALTSALARRGHEILAVSQDPERLVDMVAEHQPDVCVLDVAFTGSSGIDAAAALRRREPAAAILLLTGTITEAVWQAYEAMIVDGIVNKACDIDVLQAAISRIGKRERVVEGWTRLPARARPAAQRQLESLTNREREVLEFLVGGASTETIALQLGVSSNTVRTHVQNVLHKLGVHGRGKAAMLAAHSTPVDLASLPGSFRPR